MHFITFLYNAAWLDESITPTLQALKPFPLLLDVAVLDLLQSEVTFPTTANMFIKTLFTLSLFFLVSALVRKISMEISLSCHVRKQTRCNSRELLSSSLSCSPTPITRGARVMVAAFCVLSVSSRPWRIFIAHVLVAHIKGRALEVAPEMWQLFSFFFRPLLLGV